MSCKKIVFPSDRATALLLWLVFLLCLQPWRVLWGIMFSGCQYVNSFLTPYQIIANWWSPWWTLILPVPIPGIPTFLWVCVVYKDPEGQTDGSLQLSKLLLSMGEDETLELWITVFQKKPMHTAFKRLEPHMRNCSNNMVWETVPDFRSCVDEASVQLMNFCSRNLNHMVVNRSTGRSHTPPF